MSGSIDATAVGTMSSLAGLPDSVRVLRFVAEELDHHLEMD